MHKILREIDGRRGEQAVFNGLYLQWTDKVKHIGNYITIQTLMILIVMCRDRYSMVM